MNTVPAITRGIRFCCGFFLNKADQSMVRAVTLICALCAGIPAMAAYRVATRPHLDGAAAGTITALTGMVGAFVAAGCVALAKRSRPQIESTPPTPPESPS